MSTIDQEEREAFIQGCNVGLRHALSALRGAVAGIEEDIKEGQRCLDNPDTFSAYEAWLMNKESSK